MHCTNALFSRILRIKAIVDVLEGTNYAHSLFMKSKASVRI